MLVLLRLYARLPLPLIHALGALLGGTALLRRRHRETIAANLRLAGLYTPGRVLRVGMELGKSVLELPRLWLTPLERVAGWVREVHGWEHVEAARQRGQGIVLMGPHLSALEVAGSYFATRIPVTYLYQRLRQDWAHELMLQGRQRGQAHLAETSFKGVRALLAAVRRGEAAWVLPDQAANGGEGLWMRFFGHWAYMPTLPYRLLQSERSAGLLFAIERLGWGRGYRLWVEPLPDLPSDVTNASAEVNARMEAMVRRLPDQYLWNYRLYRTPPGAPPQPAGEAL